MESAAAIYVRCSTAHQNLEVQLNDLKKYAEARGLKVFDIFEDHGISGAKDRRSALDKMMKMARQRKFSHVLVWRLDRLGRNTRHLFTLLDEFASLQISLVSHQEGFDLSTPTGRVIATVMAALSSFERELTKERVIAGIQNAKAKGKRLGRPPVTVDKGEVQALRAEGLTYRRMAQKMGVSVGSIQKAMKKHVKSAS